MHHGPILIQAARLSRHLAIAGALGLIVLIGGACATAVPHPAPARAPIRNELFVV
jgi:hypothetical protein